MFSKIYFKALALPILLVALYTGAMVYFVEPKIEERTIYLEETAGKAHLQEIATVVSSTARELKAYHENSLVEHKEELKNVTDVAYTLVEELYSSSQPNAVKEHILSEVETFRKMFSSYYKTNQDHDSPAVMQRFLKKFIRLYRYDSGTGYFFITKGSECVLHPIIPSMEGTDLKDIRDENGVFFIQEMQKIIDSSQEGFLSYKWPNPVSGKVENKITYVFYFAPFDWIIGTGLYLEEITRQKQKEATDYVANLRYGSNEYFYISNYDSVLISHPTLQGEDMSEVRDPDGTLIVPPMVQIAREKGEGFHSYSWFKLAGTSKKYKKLSFAKHIPNWEWMIGTGVYLDNIEEQVEAKKVELVKNLRNLLTTTRIAATGYIYIFDSKGNMILHPNSNIEGINFLNLKNPNKDSLIFDDLVAAYNSEKKELYYLWDKPTDKGNYIYEKVSWIDYNEDFDWYICSSAYIAEINATANRLKQYMWMVSFVLLSLALFLSAWFFKKLLKPIETLSQKALQVKDGELGVRSHYCSNDEIGMLAQTFDGMLDTIEDNISVLDRKVHERTRDLEKMVKKLDFLASHDPMTGIYNRRKFFELANKKFSEEPEKLYAAMIDIDKFKNINDTYGHPIGDKVITAVAQAIQDNIEEDTILGRLGGEEFGVIWKPPALKNVMKHMESIRRKVAELETITTDGTVITCTISIGIVKSDETIDSLVELLHKADAFLYKAKGLGRNKTVFRIK